MKIMVRSRMRFENIPFGGVSRKGKRKIQRPFDSKRAMHVVMRAPRARGAWSFLDSRNKALLHLMLLELCEKYDLRLFGYENVGNHLHFLIQFPARRELRAFLRVFAQRAMFLVTGAKKGSPKGRFFETIAFSRMVDWGRDFRNMKKYLLKNLFEASGFSREEVRYYHQNMRWIW